MPPVCPTINVLNYNGTHWAVNDPSESIGLDLASIGGQWNENLHCWLVPKGKPGIQIKAHGFEDNTAVSLFETDVSNFSAEPMPPLILEAIEAQRDRKCTGAMYEESEPKRTSDIGTIAWFLVGVVGVLIQAWVYYGL